MVLQSWFEVRLIESSGYYDVVHVKSHVEIEIIPEFG